MATINSLEMVQEIIDHNGHYYDDPVVVKIVQYNNAFDGGLAYGLIYEGMSLDAYKETPFIINPVVMFEKE